uniref:Pentatricopeptide repeat-containing protein n=1 Tax=Rhizophora mucronata TaxID=61149 RepID=A0A2P2LM95_RHIMU
MIMRFSSTIRRFVLNFGGGGISLERTTVGFIHFKIKSSFDSFSIALAHFTTITAIAIPTSSDSENEQQPLQQKQHQQQQQQQQEQQLFEASKLRVIDILYSLKTHPNMAFTFFYAMKDRGFQHDVDTYAAIIRILCDSGLHRNLRSIFLDLIGCDDNGNNAFDMSCLLDTLISTSADDTETQQQFSHFLVKVYDALVKSYVSAGMFDEAITALFQTKRRGILPHIFTCNFLINQLIENSHLDMALAIYKYLKKLGLKPNGYTYSIVIKGLCRRGNLEEAVDIFQEMEEAGITSDSFAYAAYIEGLCVSRRSDLGYQVLKAWKAANIPIDVYAFTVVIQGFCNEMKLNEAEKILHDMECMGLDPDTHCYSALICGFCKSGNLVRALAFHNDMLLRGTKTNCMIVNSILKCMYEQGIYSKVLDQFSEFKELGIFLDELSCSIVIDAFCKLSNLDEVVACFKHDILSYNVIVAGLCRKGLVSKAVDVLDYMEKHELKPNNITQNVMIKNLCIGGKMKEAEAIFNSIEDKSLDNYAAMITGYCKANHTVDAFKLFFKVARQGYLVNKSCCYELLQNLYEKGNNDEALVLFKTMLASNMEPSKYMCTKIIAAFCSARDMKKAQSVFDLLLERGLSPDVISYTVMIHGYCKVNCIREAIDIFHDMKNRGIKPDLITFTVLLDGHLKIPVMQTGAGGEAGESKEETLDTSTIWKEMKEVGIRPDVICYTVLIDKLCKAGNLGDAVDLYDEMINSGLEPDMVTHMALLSGYCNMGNADMAVQLLDQLSSKGMLCDPNTISTLRHHILKFMETKKTLK